MRRSLLLKSFFLLIFPFLHSLHAERAYVTNLFGNSVTPIHVEKSKAEVPIS
jgi:hypothetical protein